MKNLLLISFVSSLFLSSIADAQDLKPTETEVLVYVTATNTLKEPLKKEIFILSGIRTKKSYTIITDSTGKSRILLPKGDTYRIIYKDLTDTSTYTQVEIPATPGKYTSQLSITVEPAKVYTLRNVLFDTGKATLKPTSFKALNDLVEVLKLKPSLVIEIGGHTDNTGTADINLKLSQDRADAVRNYLIMKGISAARLTAIGYGDTRPVADNDTDEGRAKNRRTEVTIVKE